MKSLDKIGQSLDPWTSSQNWSNPWTVQGIPGRLATMHKPCEELSESIRQSRVKCMLTPTNLKTIIAQSHVFSHAGACMQIQESMKGGYGMYNYI